MPLLSFDFSKPEPIYDPLSKDPLAPAPYLISGTCQFAEIHKVHLDVVGNSEKGVIEYAKQFNPGEGKPETPDSTSAFLIKRTETTTPTVSEESSANRNMLVNIRFELADSSDLPTIELDIDPPISFKTRHVYTFSSNKESSMNLTIWGTEGKVTGQLKKGAWKIVKELDPLRPVPDKHFTTDKKFDAQSQSNAFGTVKRFLDSETMESKLAELTEVEEDPVPINKEDRHRISVKNMRETVEVYFALIITGIENGPNAYQLTGRIEREAKK
ncbi:MAG: hypothetical protein DHS20C20_03720 [Ardenticatenaceae bacterium]|nr:MAG: hypothetical protein DHS20C20_03720 [Ardenticatenaceae bacterium]